MQTLGYGVLSKVILEAGYLNGLCQKIFAGSIVYMRMGREDAVTSFLTIVATHVDEALSYGTINAVLNAGDTSEDEYRQILNALKPFGVTAGYSPFGQGYDGPPVHIKTFARGKCFYDKIVNELNEFASSLDCIWNIQDAMLNIYPSTGQLPVQGDVTVLTPQTGLIGVPELTFDGLTARCLLNPAITLGSLISIPTQYISRAWASSTQLQPDMTVSNPLGTSFGPQTSTSSMYRVYALTHLGDNRGTGPDWFTEVICVSADKDAKLPITNTFLNAMPAPQNSNATGLPTQP